MHSSHNIVELKDNEIFVFGSNEGGRHGKGAAKQAVKWGAKKGQGEGLMGSTYGIPTKDKDLNVLSLKQIMKYIDKFLAFAEKNPQLKFLVTAIGTGLAGYEPKEIALMFPIILPPNVHLPKVFTEIRNEIRKAWRETL